MLGLEGRDSYLKSEVQQVFDNLLRSPPKDPYTPATLANRAKLLERAKYEVLQHQGRVEKGRGMDVPGELMPAALVVMEELGRQDLVARLGPMVLAMKGVGVANARDVHLAMALASCGAAAKYIAQKQVSQAISAFEDALTNLRAAGPAPLAPTLMADIEDALKPLRAADVRARLRPGGSGAGKEEAAARKQALDQLKVLLKRPEAGAARGKESAVNGAYVAEVLEGLTAAELVSVAEWEAVLKSESPVTWFYRGLPSRVVTALLVAGFTQRQPALIRRAAAIARQYSTCAAAQATRAVCEVLLGQVPEALEALKAAEKAATSGGTSVYEGPTPSNSASAASSSESAVPTNGKAYAFVEGNSPAGGGDLLPGLCLYTERWLSQVGFPAFRDTAASPPSASLGGYFDAPQVEAALKNYSSSSEKLTTTVASWVGGIRQASAGLLQRSPPATVTKERGVPPAGSAAAATSRPAAPPARPAASPADSGSGFLGTLIGGVLLVGAVALVGYWGRRSAAERRALATAPVVNTEISVAAEGPLDQDAASKLIRNWQDIKAKAMGPRYETELLPKVLVGNALKSYVKNVRTFREAGTYMRFLKSSCDVYRIDTSKQLSNSGFTVVYARFNEVAEQLELGDAASGGASTVPLKEYNSDYVTIYKVVRCNDGNWRISELTVAGADPAPAVVAKGFYS